MKRRKKTTIYRLLSFCDVRWYSSWMVMTRFFSLFEALTHLKEECQKSNFLKANGGKEFIHAMARISKDMLFRAIHYLRPLVQGIDYCQRDDCISMHIIPMIQCLQIFYNHHSQNDPDTFDQYEECLFPLSREVVQNIFEPRIALFQRKDLKLQALFTDKFIEDPLEELREDDERVQRFARALVPELTSLVSGRTAEEKQRKVNQARSQAIRFMLERRFRYGVTVHRYLKENSKLFPELIEVYEDVFSCPASTAAVERSFSVQGCFMLPRRNRLQLETVRNMMVVRMNSLLVQKTGKQSEFMEYIISHSMVPVNRQQD